VKTHAPFAMTESAMTVAQGLWSPRCASMEGTATTVVHASGNEPGEEHMPHLTDPDFPC
jgi:hypothetical protein